MAKDFIKRLGFVEDVNNFQLGETFKDDTKLKEIHIDIYSENPLCSSPLYMLILRTSEVNAFVSHGNNRLIVKKSDRYKTHVMNILSQKISEVFYRASGEYTDFILNVQNVYYKISVLN